MNRPTRPGTPHKSETSDQAMIGLLLLGGALAMGPVTITAAVLLLRWARRREEGRAWALLSLAALAGLAATLFTWPMIANKLAAIWHAIATHFQDGPDGAFSAAWRDIGLLWVLTLPLAPVLTFLLTLLWSRNAEDQALAQERTKEVGELRASARAAHRATKVPERVGERLVLGAPIIGDLSSWVVGGSFTYPPEVLGRHLVVVGGSGTGKTETLLRLAYGAARVYGWRVIYLDAKGDYTTAARFFAAMQKAGLDRVALFPAQAYDGWRGGATAILNRLMAIEDYSEPYYKSMAKLLLGLAVNAPPAPPGSSDELLARLRLEELKQLYAGQPEAADLAEIKGSEARGAYHRYRGFFDSLAGKLDGGWAYEDVEAAYVLLDGLALKEEASSLGRYLLEDFAHYVARRKPANQHVLLIVDEFSALAGGADAANLFERVRSYGAAVIVSSQSYAGLGKGADRILDAAAGLIVHQCADPERLVARAGARKQLEMSIQLADSAPTGMGSGRMQETFRVRPDQARQLAPGECFIIAGGRAQKVRVARLEVPQAAVREAERVMAEVDDRPTTTDHRPPITAGQPVSDAEPSVVSHVATPARDDEPLI